MAKYAYPAIFTREENGYSVVFPDIDGCYTVEYRKLFDNRAVKKTLTIPNWLNTLSERAGINFSTALQEALKAKLGIQ